MGVEREVRELVNEVASWEGWRVEETKKGWKLLPADKTQSPVMVHKTPSDWRWRKNVVSQLRKRGAPL